MKKIVILATGGTIAGSAAAVEESLSYMAATLSIDRLIEEIPAVRKIACITGEQVAQLDSADLEPSLWLLLARRVNTLLQSDEVDGVVITHGTDTLEETAYFLQLTVKSRKPVVVVGAMRPATAMSHDGCKNLFDAVALAASEAACGHGVLVCLNDTINSGRDVTKTSTMLPNAFVAPDLGCLGYMQGTTPMFYRQQVREHTMATEFDITGVAALPRVDIVYSYAGYDAAAARGLAEAGAKGIVHAGMGNGNMSQRVCAALRELAAQGIVIVRSSRVRSGIVTRNGAVDDDGCGFVSADSLNPQKARVLLMLALLTTRDPAVIQGMFERY